MEDKQPQLVQPQQPATQLAGRPVEQPSSLYPTATRGAAGSNPEVVETIQARQAYDPSQPTFEGRTIIEKMPTGIYVIAGLLAAGAIISLFDKTGYYTLFRQIALILDLLLAVGLLTRSNLARQALIVFCALGVILFGWSLVHLINLNIKSNNAMHTYGAQLLSRQSTQSTTTSQASVDYLKAAMEQLQNRLNHIFWVGYATAGIGLAEDVGIVVYLTRPKVGAIFRRPNLL